MSCYVKGVAIVWSLSSCCPWPGFHVLEFEFVPCEGCCPRQRFTTCPALSWSVLRDFMPAVSAGLSFEGVSLSGGPQVPWIHWIGMPPSANRRRAGPVASSRSPGSRRWGEAPSRWQCASTCRATSRRCRNPCFHFASSAQGIQVRGERSAVLWLVPQGLLGDCFWIRSPKPWPTESPSISFRD